MWSLGALVEDPPTVSGPAILENETLKNRLHYGLSGSTSISISMSISLSIPTSPLKKPFKGNLGVDRASHI